MKTTNNIIANNNKKIIEKLIPEKGSAFEEEIIIWRFKIYLN